MKMQFATLELAMLTNEIKRKIFMKSRSENYRDSLRLEGLAVRSQDVRQPELAPVITAVKIKRVR